MRRPIVIFCTLLTSHFKPNIIAIISILEKHDISIKYMNQATSDNTHDYRNYRNVLTNH